MRFTYTTHSAGALLLRVMPAMLALTGCGRVAPASPGNAVAVAPTAQRGPLQPEISLRRPQREEARLLPPASVIGADPDRDTLALVFSSDQQPARLTGWYRAAARQGGFTLDSEMDEGAEHILSGRIEVSGKLFTVRLAPDANGGTTGMVLVTPP